MISVKIFQIQQVTRIGKGGEFLKKTINLDYCIFFFFEILKMYHIGNLGSIY